MRINVQKDYLVLQPESEAETFQLQRIKKDLQDFNVKHSGDRQWNWVSVIVNLSHASDK